ncbi:MAG: cystathionine beta-lyase [Proteobacteria bacterium]|nr:cystathionine beta-lyase [Pseudomonadota bacterium]
MKKDTLITAAGRDPEKNFGIVNPPVYHASTVTFPTVEALEAATRDPFKDVFYGRYGTPTAFALEEAMAELEGGYRAIACASGLGAIMATLLAFLGNGDHLLMVDSAYGPTRKICDLVLARFGIETTFYDPMIGAGIGDLMGENTRVVFAESPGSLTFEVQDLPAIARAAHEKGAVVVLDNSWATPLHLAPFELGIDISIHSATKYLAGHSDLMLGIITTTEATFDKVRLTSGLMGGCPGPDDCYLALRGLRTLAVRLARHQETGLALAHWLQDRADVARILHPAFEDCPGHDIWKRDFTGASGLFSIVLEPCSAKAVAAMLDGMERFAMGYSWGGYESLILPADPGPLRTATEWRAEGPLIRLHPGLEDAGDLIADLEKGFERLNRNG